MPEPSPTANLEIFLSSPVDGQYRADLRYFQPDDQTEDYPAGGMAVFDFDDLRSNARKPEAYGELLRQAVFGEAADPRSQYYSQKLATSQGAGQEMRLRIMIDRGAHKLQDLRWETLRDPPGGAFLAVNANQPFSRFLPSEDRQRIDLRSRANLKALIFVANPTDLKIGLTLGNQVLAEVPVQAEVQRAQNSLVDFPRSQGITETPRLTVVASDPLQPGNATYKALTAKLGQGYDILYLVCHGALLEDNAKTHVQQPYLVLEKSDGSYDQHNASDLVTFVRNLPASLRPRLVVLASCQSGGQGKVPNASATEEERSYDQGALAALGPRLVEAGVPAVVAQQADVRMATISIFTPAFFTELLRSGQVDKAVGVARNQIRHEPDWWVPVLYLRLSGGRLWFESGYAKDGEFDAWGAITPLLNTGECTPVLGSGMVEFMTGSARAIALRWARANNYPLEYHQQEELYQVAEYLDKKIGEVTLCANLYRLFADELKERFKDNLPAALAAANTKQMTIKQLSETCINMISAIGAARRQDPFDPYRVLAGLKLPIYITANPDFLLEDAIREQNNTPPKSLYFCWKEALITPQAIEAWNQRGMPSPECPLVYHLFGRLDQPSSLVLTEDDYFDFLMWINRSNHQLPIPEEVTSAWQQNALLFLGFQLTDWNFRLLYRSILTEERSKLRPDIRSVAVQLQPGDDNLRPVSARDYLTKYFGDKFNIYWGSAEDYLRDLRLELDRS